MAFTQTVTVQADDPGPLADLLQTWHRDQHGVAPGYERARLLADQDRAGRFVIEVDFSSEAEAQDNNARPETERWADDLRRLARGEPEYGNFAVSFATG